MMRALISAARLPVRQPSSTMTARRVRATDARIVASSSGRSVRRSITSASMPSLRERRRGVERLAERAAVRDERHVATAPPDRRALDLDGAGVVREVALERCRASRARR